MLLADRAATARTSFGKRQIRADGWHIHPMYL